MVDANVLIAALVDSDSNHVPCASYVESIGTPILVSVLALTEVAHFVEKHLGADAELDLIRSIRDGEILPVYDGTIWDDLFSLAERYVDGKLGMVDASLFVCAELLSTDRVATLDMLHYSVVTPRTPAFSVERPA
ncbi:PIN domain-containing protein [Microbacterium sp. NPDC080220]|uniref:type II toxin-antitoxin system VapC family toxin n=1 Tax=Microbacterium sp. NPDC080220 TaxID=3161017 RepID=UPI003445173E